MDATFAPVTGNFVRVQHSVYHPPLPHDKPDLSQDPFGWLSEVLLGHNNPPPAIYYVGGPDGWVFVSTGFQPGYAGYTGSDPFETTVALRKQGGGRISSGDVVSIEISSGRQAPTPGSGIQNRYFFRVDNATNGGDVIADSSTPFTPTTSFIVTYLEVRSGVGVRPDTVICQACAAVQGVVTDAKTGQPIAGAAVTVRGVLDGTPFVYQATTASDGTYQVADTEGRSCVPQGNVTVSVEHDRHVTPPARTVAVPGTGSINVSFQLDCTLVAGCVQNDDATHSRVSNAVVVLTESDGTALPPKLTAADGTFVFECVRHGDVTIWTDGVSPKMVRVPDSGVNVPCLEVQLGCADICGTVTVDGTNPPQPIGGATVKTVPNSSHPASQSAVTDSAGHYCIHCVLAGNVNMAASAPGFLPDGKQAMVPSTGLASVDFRLKPLPRSPQLFPTGVNSAGSVLTGGSADPHWTVVSGPGIGTSRPAVVVSNPNTDWFVSGNSAWVSVSSDALIDTGGPFTIEQQFDLTGINLTTVTISGLWSADNNAVLFLNGAQAAAHGTGTFTLTATDPANFHTSHAFTITNGFVPGINRISIELTNAPADPGVVNPGGVNVFDLTITGTP
jgi:hypothetical protein